MEPSTPVRDLNDLRLFAAVVTHHGFSAAGRALGVPKSRISARVAALEAELGVRLLERSTRRLRVTDVGHAFFERCEAVLSGVEAAEAVAAEAQLEPKGMVRVSCPPGLMGDVIPAVLPSFALRYPLVRVQVRVLNRPVDLVEERIDVAFRVRTELDGDPGLIMRMLGRSRSVLVASPSFAATWAGPSVEALALVPTLGGTDETGRTTWTLVGPERREALVTHEPRIACADFNLLRAAAVEGLGVALLPYDVCVPALRSGALVRVLPGWEMPESLLHLVFTARRGLLPGVRAFIDHVAEAFPRVQKEQDAQCQAPLA